MALKKEKKVEIVNDLEKSLKGTKSVVFVKFDKLKVADANTFRRNLQKEGIGYFVSKKTLLKRALAKEKIIGELPELQGQMAIAFGNDLIAPAREVFNFHKTHRENISIIGGVFKGKYLNAGEMLSIATIPPLQILRGMFVNLINSPIQRLAVALDQIALLKK